MNPPPAPANWDAPLAPGERDGVLTALADAIRRRGLETPAILLLEMHRPLGLVASHAALLFAPMIAPVVGIDRLHRFAQILRDPEAVEALIERLGAPPAAAPGATEAR